MNSPYIIQVGDLVRAQEDVRRDIDCVGIVIGKGLWDSGGTYYRIMWSSENSPIGCWSGEQLRVVDECR